MHGPFSALPKCKTCIFAHVTRSLAFRNSSFALSPRSLSAKQKAEGVTLSTRLLEVLTAEQWNCFEYILTRDDSWFFFKYSDEVV
jgi:hypothetical protein